MPKLLDSLPESLTLNTDEWRSALREQLGRQIEATTAAQHGEQEKRNELEKLQEQNNELNDALQHASKQQQTLEQTNASYATTVERQRRELADLTANLMSVESHLPELQQRSQRYDELASQSRRQASEIAQLTELLLSAERRLRVVEDYFTNYLAESSELSELSTERSLTQRIKNKVIGKPNHEKTSADRSYLTATAYFSARWYLEQNPDVAAAGIDPYEHYLLNGASEGRNPSPLFDTQWYLKTYPDVAESGINPLIHFLRFGLQEGRHAVPPVDKG